MTCRPLLLTLLGLAAMNFSHAATRKVAMIFDDGPKADMAPAYLDVFKAKGVHATFGAVVGNVQADAALAKRILAEGHELANHSFAHKHPAQLGDADLDAEIIGAQEIMTRSTGVSAKWYWPPFLEQDDRVRARVAKAGLRIYNPKHLVVSKDYDTTVSATELHKRAITDVTDGTVILFHEWRKETLQELPAIIDELKAQGCEFITFSELDAYLSAKAK